MKPVFKLLMQILTIKWDGNNLLHEWEENPEVKRSDSLVTWVFDEGTFTPSAKLTNQGNYSIITDQLGTPVEAYDSDGKKVWEQELDIYSRVKPRPIVKKYGSIVDDGMFDEHFIPFRYQGQYHDEETDLYYNRFRYYDPQLGQYTQQDPIGLAGGNPTLYGYVGDPNIQIDPLGLSCRGRNRLQPDPSAQGAHTTFKIDPATGKITKYQTWEPNPRNPSGFDSGVRFDGSGSAHFNKVTGEPVPTPHVHDPLAPGGVRPALPSEIPK